jgi:transposase
MCADVAGAVGKTVDALDAAIETIDKDLAAEAKADDESRRLMSIPGIGPVTASAIVATVPDMRAFASGREFSAFLGLTPRQHSSGGKERRDCQESCVWGHSDADGGLIWQSRKTP